MLLIEDRLEAAEKHLATGNPLNAALLFESVLDIAPGHVDTLQALAKIRLEMGDIEQALPLARQAVQRSGATAETLVLLAKSAVVANEPEEAAKAVEDALSIEPAHPTASQIRAEFLMQSGDVAQAEAVLKAALTKHPNNPDVLAGLSGLYANIGLARPALALAQDALSQAPEKTEYLAQLGRCLAEMGDHADALDFLTKAHLSAPSNPLLMIYLANSQASLGLLNEAQVLAKRVTTMYPDLLAGWLNLIRIKVCRGETKEVFAEFLQHVREHKDNLDALIALAVAYRSVGATANALELLQPILRQLPDGLSPGQRQRVLAITRDCLLSGGAFDQLGRFLQKFDGHADAMVDMPNPDVSKLADLPTAFKKADLSVDPSLTNLEALVLLRCVYRRKNSRTRRKIYAPSYLKQIVDLLGPMEFVAYDEPTMAEPDGDVAQPVALSAVFALPPKLLRKYKDTCPYISASDDRRQLWRDALKDMPRPLVALAWDSTRPGILAQDYQPLFGDFGGTFISVMWDESRHQLKASPDIIDAGTHIKSFADLAALLAETDLLVGPDGIPTHMAGAMGRPGVLLTQPAWPWYWHSVDGRASWYPSITTLQTSVFGNWSELMGDIAPQLLDIVNNAANAGEARAVGLKDKRDTGDKTMVGA